MPVAYSKPYQISEMMRHIENPGIVRTVYSGIFRHIQGLSAILSHVQALRDILRQVLLRHIEPYSDIFRTLCNPSICNCAIFTTLVHLEPEASSKACQTCKITFFENQKKALIASIFALIFLSKM